MQPISHNFHHHRYLSRISSRFRQAVGVQRCYYHFLVLLYLRKSFFLVFHKHHQHCLSKVCDQGYICLGSLLPRMEMIFHRLHSLTDIRSTNLEFEYGLTWTEELFALFLLKI